jgi:hypothetical protein
LSESDSTTRVLADRIEVCLFDLYGTLVDIQKGLTDVVTPYPDVVVSDVQGLADILGCG